MNIKRLIRDLHHWGSIVIAIPIVVMIGAGILLMLKKEIAWIQPETQRGTMIVMADNGDFEAQSLQTLFAAARSVERVNFQNWQALDRVDIKPNKGVIKFIGHNRWEVQVDLVTGEVLQVAYRRSDLIESIHDGSFFAAGAKLFLFLPAGLVLLGLWATGMYLFFLPHYKNYQKSKRKKSND